VGANKNSVKIIAEDDELYAQGYFVYDSHKSGAQTVSHLRFGKKPISAPYLIQKSSFVACRQFGFVERVDVLRLAADGAVFLLNSPYTADEVWHHLPRSMQQTIIDRRLRFFVIDASRAAQQVGLRGRTNTILQTCFFAISGVLPQAEAIKQKKNPSRKPTPARAPKSFAATSPPWTKRSAFSPKSRFPRHPPANGNAPPSSPPPRRSSCARSPRK
jgi:pyruvate-ferredoxin/flavodoxin oxidoreductase